MNKIAEMLSMLDAVYYSKNKSYRLDEYTEGEIYPDINTLLSFPQCRGTAVDMLFSVFRQYINTNTCIAAAGESSIPFASIISKQTSLPMVYIRDSHKKHGKKNQIEGSVPPGSKCIIFTDLYSSSGKIKNSVDVLEEKNCDIIQIITVLNFTDNNLYKTGAGKTIEIVSLADFKDLDAVPEYSRIIESKKAQTPDKSDRRTIVMAEDVAEILLKLKAVALSLTAPFRYASGILSPVYCDNRLLISSPENWKIITDWMTDIIKNNIGTGDIQVIAGTSTAGIPHAAVIADNLKLPMIYVKSVPDEYGKNSNIGGQLLYGKKVLIIEDLVSTGKSSIEAVKTIRSSGGIADTCLAIFSYEMESAVKAFKEAGCDLYTVSDFSTLIKTAVRTSYISEQDAVIISEWNCDPENWGRKRGYE